MTNGNDKCSNCGGDRAIHHYQTDQCPAGGVEAPVGKQQEFKTSTFVAQIPFDPPSRMARDMTVREYFAAMAMTMFPVSTDLAVSMKYENPHNHVLIAEASVKIADALIEALNK